MNKLNLNPYINWLKDRNRSLNTINIYTQALQQFFQVNPTLNTENIRYYLKTNLTKYQPNTLKIFRQALSSYAKFTRKEIEWERINELFQKWEENSLTFLLPKS